MREYEKNKKSKLSVSKKSKKIYHYQYHLLI